MMARFLYALARIVPPLVFASLCAAQVPAISDTDATKYVGQRVTVQGKVANVYTSKAGNRFLNFGRPYPDQTFAAVIFAANSAKFPDPIQWDSRTIAVTGTVRLYKGRPEIILTERSQLAKLD